MLLSRMKQTETPIAPDLQHLNETNFRGGTWIIFCQKYHNKAVLLGKKVTVLRCCKREEVSQTINILYNTEDDNVEFYV